MSSEYDALPSQKMFQSRRHRNAVVSVFAPLSQFADLRNAMLSDALWVFVQSEEARFALLRPSANDVLVADLAGFLDIRACRRRNVRSSHGVSSSPAVADAHSLGMRGRKLLRYSERCR
ncbi:hypothetical protein KC345_g306 [Hortaea werneckii]|nr:hypothetical protein KC345_g306 [Hortaea werneckii]